jgi:hypothetical protein
MIYLVHLLICDNKWIFKMHGATIKIKLFLFVNLRGLNITLSFHFKLLKHRNLHMCFISPTWVKRSCPLVIKYTSVHLFSMNDRINMSHSPKRHLPIGYNERSIVEWEVKFYLFWRRINIWNVKEKHETITEYCTPTKALIVYHIHSFIHYSVWRQVKHVFQKGSST